MTGYPAPAPLDLLREAYEADGNPLRVWMAVAIITRRGGTQLPQWVCAYLARAAVGILDVARNDTPRAQRPERVAEALNLKPRGAGRRRDHFDAYADPMPGILLAGEFWRERAHRTHDEARAIVAEHNGVSERTVERAWTRWAEAVIPPHLRKNRNRP